MTFRLAHLSDPHVGPLPSMRLRDLRTKRLTGYWNYRSSRAGIHRMDVLAELMLDIKAHHPDHVALTGDLVNIGLTDEFSLAARLLQDLGDAGDVSIVPGNHDAYVRGSIESMQHVFGRNMCGDDGGTFPYLRLRGDVALIGISSAIPTLPFFATGHVGQHQCDEFRGLVRNAREIARAVVVMIHHPPHVGGARWGRGLTDARVFQSILYELSPDLVIHGHNHRMSIARIAGACGPIPIVGVASASAVPGSPAHRAAYHLFTIETSGTGPKIGLDVRGIETTSSPVTQLHHFDIC